MRNLVCLFLAVLLSVLSASCTKDNPERYTAETAAYCKTRSSTDIPDSYMDLVVRVAGFSAYFVEVYREAQDDLIRRTEMSV